MSITTLEGVSTPPARISLPEGEVIPYLEDLIERGELPPGGGILILPRLEGPKPPQNEDTRRAYTIWVVDYSSHSGPPMLWVDATEELSLLPLVRGTPIMVTWQVHPLDG